ncbi:MAG: serine hydrolase [Rubrivivax sp.]|nr:serine hydrolase [Rubrivivax sp.]
MNISILRIAASLPLLLAVTASIAQARFDTTNSVLTVPTIDVDGQTYRDLAARLDADGRLTILALTAPTPPGGPDLATRATAATATAQGHALCQTIRPFYWEIGDAAQRLAGASIDAPGSLLHHDAGSVMPIASASKWLYGAYVAERRNGAPTEDDIRFLNFHSGYTSFAPNGCQAGDTVASCVARDNNGVLTPAHVGRFSYGGGHMQKHASLGAPGMALGALDSAGLAVEMRRLLGTEINFSFSQPQPAGGVRSTAADYATFLRKLLKRQLKLAHLLGSFAVCTNPASCASALNTPVPSALSWHYGLGYWIEDDPGGDGAFSSAGAFGFYPWIDADRRYYGVIARVAAAGGAGFDSAACGAMIRKAWSSGVVVTSVR